MRVRIPFVCCPVSRYAAGIRYFVRVHIDRKCPSIAIVDDVIASIRAMSPRAHTFNLPGWMPYFARVSGGINAGVIALR